MKKVQKILFPIDFASNYEPLLPWVSTFAEKFGATVYVLFVTQDLSGYSTFYVPHGNIESFQTEALEAAKKKMQDVVKDSFKGFAKLEARVELGSPGDKILEVDRLTAVPNWVTNESNPPPLFSCSGLETCKSVELVSPAR